MKIFFAALCALVLCLALAAPLRAQDPGSEDIREIDIEDGVSGVSYPEFTGKASEAVRARINAALAAPLEQLRVFASDPDDPAIDPPSLYLEFNVARRTGNLLSVSYEGSIMHPGTAHPTNPMFGVTVDLGTGRTLELPDLFVSGCDFKAALLREAQSWLANTGEEVVLLSPLQSIKLDDPDPWTRPGFFLTPYTLVIFYQEYVYTPHAYGPLVMELSTKNLSECLKKEFMPAP